VEQHDIRRLVVERERACVAFHKGEVRQVVGELARSLEEERRRIDARGFGNVAAARERADHCSGAAAHLDDACVRREVDVPEVRLAHLTLLGVGCAQLENGGQLLEHGGVGLGDRGIDVRHARSIECPSRGQEVKIP
jgi:hypothetical protein